MPPAQANYAAVRYAASHYIYTHPEDFLPFLPSVDGEDGAGATAAGLMSRAAFERYCVSIRDTGAWGGEPEILALSRAYNVPIHVIQGGTPPIVVHNPTGAPQEGDLREKKALRISYHRRMYGLGEVCINFNSVDLSISYIGSTTIPCDRAPDCLSCRIKSSTSWVLHLDQSLPFFILTFQLSKGNNY
jgi:hypothetical protein